MEMKELTPRIAQCLCQTKEVNIKEDAKICKSVYIKSYIKKEVLLFCTWKQTAS